MTADDIAQPGHRLAPAYAGFDDDHEPQAGAVFSTVCPLVMRMATAMAHAAPLAVGALASLAAAAALVPLLRRRPGVIPSPSCSSRRARPGHDDRSDPL